MEASNSAEDRDNNAGDTPLSRSGEGSSVSAIRQVNAEVAKPETNITKTLDTIFFNLKSQRILFWACIADSVLLVLFPLFHLFGWHNFEHIGFLPLLAAGFLSLLTTPFYIYSQSIFGFVKAETLKLDLRKWPCPKGAGLLGIAVFAQWVISALVAIMDSEGLVKVINESFFVSLLLPLLGTFSYWIGEKLIPRSAIQRKASELAAPGSGTGSPAQSVERSLKQYGRQNLTQVLPYLSFYSGFILFVGLVGLLPEGIGACVSSWLLASMRDANMLSNWEDPIVVDLLCGAVFSLASITMLSPLFVRLSASFQSLLEAFFSNKSGEDPLSILARILDTRSTRVPLPPRHPHIRSAFQTLIYFTFCYLLLFALVAFMPTKADLHESSIWAPLAALSSTISGWIYPSVEEANLFPHLTLNLRLFIASYIAAIAVTPFAVSSCAFLPPRKEDSLFFSPQGIMMPKAFGRKLQFWSELKRVSIERLGKKNQSVKLVFRTKTIKIETSRMEPEKLAELLALADEYAADCLMDESSIKLRSSLSKETSTSSLSENKKFESTIFVPHIPGTFIGEKKQYRVIRKLLSKPLSAVYLVRSNNGQLAVLKQFVTPNSSAKTLKQKASFMQEYDLLKKLDHPNLAKVIETFEESGACYIALEHIQGSDLRELVKKQGRRKESIVLRWALQVCEQLKYMHDQDPPILHRDLSPDNLILDEDGQMRIIDFGAAHQFMEGVTGTLIGKQSYIAPEQLRGKPSVRSDIYSFGASLYYMLSAEDPKALQQSDLAKHDLGISKELTEVIKHCTDFEETRRPRSIDELIGLLQAVPSMKQAPKAVKAKKEDAKKQFLELVEDLKTDKLRDRDKDSDALDSSPNADVVDTFKDNTEEVNGESFDESISLKQEKREELNS